MHIWVNALPWYRIWHCIGTFYRAMCVIGMVVLVCCADSYSVSAKVNRHGMPIFLFFFYGF